ncbi:MAG: four helix bundle protein [Hymenobacteraceae bacterium]|nr:four helix bundle protein [Hymenobacteraceae bacterium]MDX5397553.1 four helix bundle protein [Hymenobacteraceae bacterium]MDX5513631.1 four helix bundle protein [Hymenobacteraceae bacterium]
MTEKKFLKLRDIEAYRISFALSNYVWDVVIQWDYFEKDTVGKQFVRAVDSISANIAEGFGRYGKKDKVKFFRYAQGSFYESLDWNEKAKVREMLTQEQYKHIFTELQKLPLSLNSLIKFTNNNLTI